MSEPGRTQLHVAFDQAAIDGKCDSLRGMLRLGLDICGGVSRGVKALELAAGKGHVEVMQLLTDAGVKDEYGACLCFVVNLVPEKNSIRFLLKQYEKDSLDHVKELSGTSLMHGVIRNHKQLGPKMFRWLLDAGANTTASLHAMIQETGAEVDLGTPRASLVGIMGQYSPDEVPPTLTAIDRLFKQEDAIHAKSWLWPGGVEEKTKKKTKSTSVKYLRRRNRVVVSGLLRYTGKT